jgi:hypothetical protein
MAFNFSKMTAANKVLAGTVVGIPTTTQGTTVNPCTHSLTTNPNNYFAVSGNDLVTAQSGPMAMGQASLEVAATSISFSGYNTFTIRGGGPSSGTVTPRDLYA